MSLLTEKVAEAVRAFAQRGFVSPRDVDAWARQIAIAAEAGYDPEGDAARIRRALTAAYRRVTSPRSLARLHTGVEGWATPRLAPQMRDELERRVWAAVKENAEARFAAQDKLVARFRAWATSIPAGGQDVDQRQARQNIVKAAKQTPYTRKRAQIAETARMTGNVNDLMAQGGGAIGAIWDHVPELERKFRPEHTARHGKWYPIRGSWADARGFLRHPHGYWQDHELPGQLINCQCEAVYVYNLEDVPADMLNERGRRWLTRAA